MSNILRTLTLALCLSTLAAAQVTKTDLFKPTTPKDDSKENSASVPEAYAMSGDIKRVVVMRFKYKADLLAGMEKLIKEQKIKNAVILSGIGSVRNYHIHSVSNRTFPSKNVFIRDTETPADLVGIGSGR